MWHICNCGLNLPFFCLMEGCQQSFHGEEKMNTLTTIPVHKTDLNVNEDHEDCAMTESIFFYENNNGDDGKYTEKPFAKTY